MTTLASGAAETTNGYKNGANGNGYDPARSVREDLPPFSQEAEEAVIGACLIDPDAVMKLSAWLKPEDFYLSRLRWTYEAMVELYRRREPVDLVTLSDEMERRETLAEIGGAAYLVSLINATPSSLYAEAYGNIVFRMSMLRRLRDASGKIAKLTVPTNDQSLDDILAQAEQTIFDVTALMNRGQDGLKLIKFGMERFYDKLEYLSQNPNTLIGLPTGLVDLDKMLGGLQRSDMIVLAGRPSMGKTSLALSIALNAAKAWKKRTAIFSLEMSEEQVVQRMVSAETGIDTQKLRLGQIKENEWPKFFEAARTFSELPIFIDDTPGLPVLEMRSRARRIAAEYGLDLIIVDYLQLVIGGKRAENRTQEISFISRQIKEMARELNVPVLALSQLSRSLESRVDKRPLLSDLRDSGAIEQDSDVVLFVYRDDVYNPNTQFPNIAEIIIAKHRSGPTGVASVYFKKSLAQFVNLEVKRTYSPGDTKPAAPIKNTEGLNRYARGDY